MNHKHNILSLFDKEIAPCIQKLTKNIWIPLHIVTEKIRKEVIKIPFLSGYNQIIISGETDNVSVYLISKKDVIVFTPFMDAQDNIILIETSPVLLERFNNNLYLIKKNKRVMNRLNFSKILLINPSIKDVFPSPRLALCISSITSYIRKYQKAEVRIIDMQIGPTLNNVIKEVIKIQPDIIGISINFGQLDLAVYILKKLFSNLEIMKKKPIIVAGNILSAFGYKLLLEKFPKLIICNGEGEHTIIILINHVEKKIPLKDVPGITFIENGQVIKTSVVEIDMDNVPLPAMDTVKGIIKNKGALTMEISRGCFHSACSFCPRTHKPRKWKGMSSDIVLEQLYYFKSIFENFKIEKRIFMADEEFIGWRQDGKESKRMMEISKGMINRKYNMHYETNTRIDQIYNPQKNKEWHIERMKMLTLCKDAGLDRLLVGVESGSNSVLKRFNKKINVNDSVIALRILTSLGIGIRITFITFDPLMNFREIKENISFLERRDVYLKETDISEISYSELFEKVNENNFIKDNSLNIPFLERISYMLVNLEVLMNSNYVRMLKDKKKKYNKDLFFHNKLNHNMARYYVKYEDEIIGDIAVNCQKWIDRNFALDYCLKGLYKVANIQERNRIFNFRSNYRKLSFQLMKSLVWLFDKEDSINLQDKLVDFKDLIRNLESIKQKYRLLNIDRNKSIISVLNLFIRKMSSLVGNIEEAINIGDITDSRKSLTRVINQWKEISGWKLINP